MEERPDKLAGHTSRLAPNRPSEYAPSPSRGDFMRYTSADLRHTQPDSLMCWDVMARPRWDPVSRPICGGRTVLS